MSDIHTDLSEALGAIKATDIYALDLEATGLDRQNDRIIGIALTVRGKKKNTYRDWYLKPCQELPLQDLLNALEPVLLDRGKTCVVHNAGFDIPMLEAHGQRVYNRIADTMILAWLVDENRSGTGRLKLKGKGSLTHELFGVELATYAESSLSGSLFGKDEAEYAKHDTKYTMMVFDTLYAELKKQGLEKLFWELEMPTIGIVSKMELKGMYVDVPTLWRLDKEYLKRHDEIEKEAYGIIGRKINIGSPEQLSRLLFDELKWEPKAGMERGGKGLYPTNEGILSRYAIEDHEPLADCILRYRGNLKMLQTYIRPFMKMAQDDKDSRIHSTIKQTGTVTGRFCVSRDTLLKTKYGPIPICDAKPGMEVFTHKGRYCKILYVIIKGYERMWEVFTKKGKSIRCTMNHRFLTKTGWKSLRDISFDEELQVSAGEELTWDRISWFTPGRVESVWDIEVEEDHSYVGNGFVNHNSSSNPNLQNCPREKGTIKAAFKSPPGKTLIVSDYSQLELRLIAHLSQDKRMLEIYRSGGDIHQLTQDSIGCTERNVAKATNFGFIYGMSPATFKNNVWATAKIDLPLNDCYAFERNFFNTYTGIKDYHAKVEEFLKRHKYVKTLTGRRRRLEDQMRQNYGSALRQAINFTVQGFGSDVIKIAMRNYERELEKKRIEDDIWNEVFMIMQVHDEIVAEAPLEISDEAAALMKHCMETAVTISIPLVAEPAIAGPDGSWEDCK